MSGGAEYDRSWCLAESNVDFSLQSVGIIPAIWSTKPFPGAEEALFKRISQQI